MSVMWHMAANDGRLKVVREVIPKVWSVGPLWAMKVLHFKITDYCFNGDFQISELIKTQRMKCFIFSSWDDQRKVLLGSMKFSDFKMGHSDQWA